MNCADRKVLQVVRVLCALRTAAGLPPDYRGCVMAAFAATDEELKELREALGRAIDVAATKTEAR